MILQKASGVTLKEELPGSDNSAHYDPTTRKTNLTKLEKIVGV